MPANRCVAAPEAVGDLEAAFVTLGVIALQGVRKAGIGFGDRVAVLGRGVLGTLAARLAHITGAGEVMLFGRQAAGTERPGDGRYDVILDVTGNPEAIVDATGWRRPGVRVGANRKLAREVAGAANRSNGGEPGRRIRGAHAQMRPERVSLPGRWTFADEAVLYMDLVAAGRLEPFAPPVEVIDPRESWSFYRRLGRERAAGRRLCL